MSTHRSTYRFASRIAIFATVAITLLTFSAVGSNAAGLSFLESVKEFFGLASTPSSNAEPVIPAAAFTPGNWL